MLWTPILLTLLLAQPGGPPDMSGKQERKMANCPSAVIGAKTTVTKTKAGVELTIVAGDKQAAEEIVKRAQSQALPRKADEDGSRGHDGQRSGIGDEGYCPIVHQGTKVTVKAIKQGAKVSVVAEDEKDVAEIQKVATERVARLMKERR